MTAHSEKPIAEQDSLEARLRRYPVSNREYRNLINEAADTLCQMRAALVEARGLIRVGGVTYGQMMNARQMIDAALATTKIEKGVDS